MRSVKIRPKQIAKSLIKAIVNADDTFSDERKATCETCPFRTGLVCGECGCFIAIKTMEKSNYCPQNKWKEIMIVNNVGLAVNNLSEEIVTLTHVDRTSTVDFSFLNTLEFNKPIIFSFEIVNDRGGFDFDVETMSSLEIVPGCGSCTKILSDVPNILGDGSSIIVKVRYTPPRKGKVRKSIKVKFNKTENLIINFKSNVS
jgi:hypothetical protein